MPENLSHCARPPSFFVEEKSGSTDSSQKSEGPRSKPEGYLRESPGAKNFSRRCARPHPFFVRGKSGSTDSSQKYEGPRSERADYLRESPGAKTFSPRYARSNAFFVREKSGSNDTFQKYEGLRSERTDYLHKSPGPKNFPRATRGPMRSLSEGNPVLPTLFGNTTAPGSNEQAIHAIPLPLPSSATNDRNLLDASLNHPL